MRLRNCSCAKMLYAPALPATKRANSSALPCKQDGILCTNNQGSPIITHAQGWRHIHTHSPKGTPLCSGTRRWSPTTSAAVGTKSSLEKCPHACWNSSSYWDARSLPFCCIVMLKNLQQENTATAGWKKAVIFAGQCRWMAEEHRASDVAGIHFLHSDLCQLSWWRQGQFRVAPEWLIKPFRPRQIWPSQHRQGWPQPYVCTVYI